MLAITIITFGEPHLSFAKEGIYEYYKRIQAFARCELIHLKEDKKIESKLLKLVEKKFVVLLDEGGTEYSSSSLAYFLDTSKTESRHLCFIIGGPNGHLQSVKNLAHLSLSLSQLTFPHDVATMITLESLYRSLSILQGHPYHRN